MASKSWDAFKEYISSIDTFEHREYQQTIAKQASQRNTLVILPTAMGKTIIAVQVAINRLMQYPWGKIVVLAPTRPLVHQHVSSFSNFLDCNGRGRPFIACQELNGKVSKEKRTSLFIESNMIFATPQTLQNDLGSKFYDLSGCVLLVLDECHKTGERYAYNEIANLYLKQCSDPIILGLTASPGRKEEQILDLCSRLHMERITIRTPSDPDVAPYMHPIEMQVQQCDLPLEYADLELSLRDLLHEKLEQIRARGFLKDKHIDQVNKMDMIQLGRVLWSIIARELAPGDEAGNEGGSQIATEKSDRTGFFFWLVNVQAQCMKLLHMIELITTQSAYTAYQFVKKMRERVEQSKSKAGSNYRLLQETAFKKTEIFLHKCIEQKKIHPKAQLLLETLDDMLDDSTGQMTGSIIVFTQYRDTVTFLFDAIEALNRGETGPGRPFRPVRFVGQATKSSADTGLKQQDQQKALEEFRAGTHNILVATRIAEEGLDIPSVSRIIFYEPVPSEIRYIQRRGRTGRHDKGFVTILLTRGTLDEIFYKVSLGRLDSMERIVDGLKDQPLQDIIRAPLGEQTQDQISTKAILAKYEQYLVSNALKEPLDLQATADDDDIEEPGAQVEKYNARRYVDLLDAKDPAYQACIEIATRNPNTASEWHELLKKMTGRTSKSSSNHRIKRERKIPSSESGVKIFNKTTKWVYDQVKSMGTENESTGKIEITFAELKEMAKMEEILPEDFEYSVKNGIKNKYWEMQKDTNGTFKIAMKPDF
nr:helicase-related protein [Candidatus Sigynarchaeota archaeon]